MQEATGEPTAAARAAACASLERKAASASAVAASAGGQEAVAAIAAAEALLLLLPPRPAGALAEVEAAARLEQAAEQCFPPTSPPPSLCSSSGKEQQQRCRHFRRGRAFEWLVLRRCRLLLLLSKRSAAKASWAGEEARSAVLAALARFPDSEQLVDLLAETAASGGEGAAADDERAQRQLLRDVFSAAPSPAVLLRALSRCRDLRGSAAASAIGHALKGRALQSGDAPRASPQLFRALARAEVSAEAAAAPAAAAAPRARRALIRGLAACPWSRGLYLDLVDPAALAAGGGGSDNGSGGSGGGGGGGGGKTPPLLPVVPSGERAQLLEAAADAGVLLGARIDVYEAALAVAAEEIVCEEDEEAL